MQLVGFKWAGAWTVCAAVALQAVSGTAAAQSPTVVPVPRSDSESWMQRHQAMNDRVAQGNVDVIFIGDSITQGWEGGGKATWDEYYGDRNAVNLGISGDRTENVLWRLQNGNLANIKPKLAVLMIGTNNASDNSAEQIADGIITIVQHLHKTVPEMKILLLAIFPREEKPGAVRAKLDRASAIASQVADGKTIHYIDIGPWYYEADGTLPARLMPDFLHPNEAGYKYWARFIEPKVAELLGTVNNTTPPKGYVSLFNGQDLHGWKGLVENPDVRASMTPEALATAQAAADDEMRAHWSAKDGTVYFDGKGSHLVAMRNYDDFEMLLDWKMVANGDSGLYLRGNPQVQIWDPAMWLVGSGGLYNNSKSSPNPLTRADNPIGEWNQFRIKMVGDKVSVWLNDQIVVDKQALENFWAKKRGADEPLPASEQLELQAHGNEMWFKNLFIRDIAQGDGWRPLFNGKDLTGWQEVDNAGTTSWAVENGQLYTSGAGHGWLSTTEIYDNFELELEFKVPENGNSGVFIRAPHGGNPAAEGTEIQVLDDYGSEYTALKPEQYAASIYFAVGPTKRVSLPAGYWQKMKIRAEGQHVQVWLNGYLVNDANLDDHVGRQAEHPGITRKDGYIGLQNHATRVDYRNIRIRDLD